MSLFAPRLSFRRHPVQEDRRRTFRLSLGRLSAKKGACKLSDTAASKRKPIVIQVQTLTGRPFTIHVSPDDTIIEVGEKIQSKEGIPPDQQRLFFHGVTLDAFETVDDYHIMEQDTLFMTLRNRGG